MLTRTISQTDTTQAARYVGTRVLGDLLSIHEKFGMGNWRELEDLVHDVQVGLEYDCLAELWLFLYPPWASQPGRVYEYKRTEPGHFAASRHSGRIERSRDLEGGRIGYQVVLHNRDMWERLKATGRLRLHWVQSTGLSVAGMTARADGGYARAHLGLSRTVYNR